MTFLPSFSNSQLFDDLPLGKEKQFNVNVNINPVVSKRSKFHYIEMNFASQNNASFVEVSR